MSLKDRLEAQWRAPGVAQGANLCIWGEGKKNGGLYSDPGKSCTPPDNSTAYINKLRPKDYIKWGRYGAPTPRKLTPPDWLRERYKENCPRNHKTLLAEYGETYTKLDAACAAYVKECSVNRSPATETV